MKKKHSNVETKRQEVKCPVCGSDLVFKNGMVLPSTKKNSLRIDKNDIGKKGPLLQWDEKYNTGIEQIDEQHQKIVEIINTIHSSLKTETREEGFIKNILTELRNYIRFHFDLEEKMFSVTDYPEIAFHKQWHKSFMKKVRDLSDSYENNIINLRHVLKFLVDWFIEHITRTDRTYVPYVKKYDEEHHL